MPSFEIGAPQSRQDSGALRSSSSNGDVSPSARFWSRSGEVVDIEHLAGLALVFEHTFQSCRVRQVF